MGAVILKDLKEHAKYRKWKQHHIDPRNASRTPSASKELMYRLRYESPIGASPSRHLDHQKPFYDDEVTFDRSTSYRGSVGRSLGTTPSYNGEFIVWYVKILNFTNFLYFSQLWTRHFRFTWLRRSFSKFDFVYLFIFMFLCMEFSDSYLSFNS